jgi:competence protein ComGC
VVLLLPLLLLSLLLLLAVPGMCTNALHRTGQPQQAHTITP